MASSLEVEVTRLRSPSPHGDPRPGRKTVLRSSPQMFCEVFTFRAEGGRKIGAETTPSQWTGGYRKPRMTRSAVSRGKHDGGRQPARKTRRGGTACALRTRRRQVVSPAHDHRQ